MGPRRRELAMAMTRGKTVLLGVGGALLALATLLGILVYAQRQANAIASQGTYVYDGGDAYHRALVALHDAEGACNLGQWSDCAGLLDTAVAADATIAQRAGYKALRDAIAAHPPAKPVVIDHASALAELEKGSGHCDLHFWSECCEFVLKAEAFDPSIGVDPAFTQKYRGACGAALAGKAPDPVEDANRKRLGRPYPGRPKMPGPVDGG